MPLTIMQDGCEQIHYDNPAFPVYIRTGDLVSFPNMAALCHWHEELEILMPIKGYLHYNINGTVVRLQEGDAIFVNSRQLHYGFSQDGTDCVYLCLVFHPQLLCANQELQNRFVLPVTQSSHIPYLTLYRDNPAHASLLETIMAIGRAADNRELGNELKLASILYALWQYLFSLIQTQLSGEISTDGNVLILKQMLEYIRIHHSQRIRIEDICAAGGVCRTKCWQLFRKYLGQTPNDYLNAFRLEKGMQLLKSTRLTVTEIAEKCGFSNASYFTELFTRQKGCSPSKYRKL